MTATARDPKRHSQEVWLACGESRAVTVGEDEMINGGDVPPGFSSPVAEFFRDLDIGQSLSTG